MKTILAATNTLPLGNFSGPGPLGNTTGITAASATGLFSSVLVKAIGFLTVCAALWFFFHFLMAGFTYLTAGGDKAKVEKAQKTMTTSIIGFGIVVFAILFVDLIGNFLGVPGILSPGNAILKLWP
jgi:uncharacterized membrane protein